MAKQKPLKAILWTEEQIDELASIDLTDIEAAAQFWRDNAPAALADLLDALPARLSSPQAPAEDEIEV